jgi:hypothetical protein
MRVIVTQAREQERIRLLEEQKRQKIEEERLRLRQEQLHREMAAANRIWCVWRVYVSRGELQRRKDAYTRKATACTVIVYAWHMHRSRAALALLQRETRVQNTAANTIICAWRARASRRHVDALRLEKETRDHDKEALKQEKCEAARMFASCLRRALCMRAYTRLRGQQLRQLATAAVFKRLAAGNLIVAACMRYTQVVKNSTVKRSVQILQCVVRRRLACDGVFLGGDSVVAAECAGQQHVCESSQSSDECAQTDTRTCHTCTPQRKNKPEQGPEVAGSIPSSAMSMLSSSSGSCAAHVCMPQPPSSARRGVSEEASPAYRRRVVARWECMYVYVYVVMNT